MEFGVRVTAFLFPGQGSQVPGMRDEVAALRPDLLELVDASLDARRQGLRTMRLPVAGAFHSPAMEPARPAWERALAEVDFAPLRTPVISCLTAAPVDDPRSVLAASLTAPVRFREALL